MGKRLINLETGLPSQYTEGETFYSTDFYQLVEGEFTDEMLDNLIHDLMEIEDKNNILEKDTL